VLIQHIQGARVWLRKESEKEKEKEKDVEEIESENTGAILP